ncbi:hypothetical protein [Flavivirga algicola]|uniref:Uncharacterized protein n=1 Tax=Flavivirga algicola TaxID=2729136 RepID=A0ABX1RXW3_9FLAO|nr:hypothetical protein [Flavivirga algicola]NMH87513.1 hypothetical protein [Flavivirga algicola]
MTQLLLIILFIPMELFMYFNNEKIEVPWKDSVFKRVFNEKPTIGSGSVTGKETVRIITEILFPQNKASYSLEKTSGFG